jgi:tetratricopeptide (TPR) repeat protein
MNMLHLKIHVPFLAIFIAFSLLNCLSQVSSKVEQTADHDRKAKEYLRENRPDLALPELQAVIAADPDNLEARGNLGVLLFFKEDYSGAIPQFRAALALKPDLWKQQSLLGMSEKRNGEGERARKDLESAFPHLDELKVRVETGLELVELYSASRELGKAASLIADLHELDPGNIQVLYTSYLVSSDMANEALSSLALAAPESAQMHQAMAHELVRRGDFTPAIANYRQAISIDPNLPGVHFELAETLELSPNASDQEQAAAEYQAALVANRFDEQSEYRLGKIAAKEGNLQEAYERYSRAIALEPDDADVLGGLSKVLSAMGDKDKAVSMLERSIQLDPTIPENHFLLSSLYRAAGKSSDASREVQEYLKYKKINEKLQSTFKEMRLPPPKGDTSNAASR